MEMGSLAGIWGRDHLKNVAGNMVGWPEIWRGLVLQLDLIEHRTVLEGICNRGSTAEAAAAKQDFFSLAFVPTFVGLSQFAMAVTCHPCAVAMLCLVHATTCQLLSFKIHSSWWNAS